MAIDVYQPCPCGSGKKAKFCCHDLVDDMSRIAKLRDNNQIRMALQALDSVEKIHRGNLWIRITRAGILFELERVQEAKHVLRQLLNEHPDHLTAVALYATVTFSLDGYEQSKTVIERAFKHCREAVPDMISHLAVAIAAHMLAKGKLMAARQHLVLAMMLAEVEDQKPIFLELLRFDSDSKTLYPLRGVHEIKQYTGPAGIQNEVNAASELAISGCWNAAAKRFTELAQQQSELPIAHVSVLWQNAGLCRAWDGDEIYAAEALHQAARSHDDFETAVECETIAQLLDMNSAEQHLNIVQSKFGVKSVAKLLTWLDDQQQFARINLVSPSGDDDPADSLPEGVFQVLDRPRLGELTKTEIDLDTLPVIQAQVAVYTGNTETDEPAEAIVSGIEGKEFDAALQLFCEVAGDEVEAVEPAGNDDEQVLGFVYKDFRPLHLQRHFAPKTPIVNQRRIKQQQWDHFIDVEWPRIPSTALGGKPPLEAAGDSDLKVPLMASLYLLDAACERVGSVFDLPAMCDRLKLPSPGDIEVDKNTQLNLLSIMQMHRLPTPKLSDEQVQHSFNRALLTEHQGFLEKVSTEIASRPACLAMVDTNRIYTILAELCQKQSRRDEAFSWIARGCESAQGQNQAFEIEMNWRLRELSLRLEDPSDPELSPLLKYLWEFYVPKLPQLRQHLESVVALYEIPIPWGSAQVPEAAAGVTLNSGLWTPESPEEVETGKKLWIPGQD